MNPAALKTCLERENTLVVEFLHALEAETEALMDRRAHESLQAAVQRKETLADELARLGAERDALLSAAGLAGGPAGTDAAAAAHPELGPLWQALQANAAQAREHNQRNGTLIAVNLRHTQESLDALRQAAGTGAAATYDAQGRGKRGYSSAASGRAIVAT